MPGELIRPFVLRMAGMALDPFPAHLVARLRGIHTQNPDATILVRGDGAASYQLIMNAIDSINEAGITRVSLISRPAESAN